MSKIWFCSDWHLGHDREFIYGPRGFKSMDEMNQAILTRHNAVVDDEDDVYVLGDLMLGDNDLGLSLIKEMKGKLHIVYGNHDTNKRKELYKTLPNVVECGNVLTLRYRKYNFYCSHFPTLTGNLENESLHQMTLCLFGHTHSKDKFYNDMPYMYNVAMEAHNCTPVDLDTIIDEMKQKVEECQAYL